MLEFESQAWERGFRRVAGVDEAGRGPLAGPVVAAAVVFDAAYLLREAGGILAGLTDSKQLGEKERERFFDLFCSVREVDASLGAADAFEIDRHNILRATFLAMRRAVAGLTPPPDAILVDGPYDPGLGVPVIPVVDGDARSLTVAAASVMAKVVRDRLMRGWDERFPGYGLAGHKGYGTRLHTQALFERGVLPLHRRSFRPVQDALRIRSYLSRDGGHSSASPNSRT